jgi:hypothetical protein
MIKMTSAQIKRSFLIASIVGTLLIVINQLDVLINGPYTLALFLKVIITPLVPFSVSIVTTYLTDKSAPADTPIVNLSQDGINREKISIENPFQGEVTIIGIQIMLSLFWTALYIITPKGSSTAFSFEPVPMAITVMLILLLSRLILLVSGHIKNWILFIYVSLDQLLLLALITSFHIQYEQPMAFIFKSPTFVYLFLFVAIRSLGQNRIYILASGIVSCIGWLGLTIYTAIQESELVTHSYINYITGNKILVGAEIEKVVCLFTFTLILGLRKNDFVKLKNLKELLGVYHS